MSTPYRAKKPIDAAGKTPTAYTVTDDEETVIVCPACLSSVAHRSVEPLYRQPEESDGMCDLCEASLSKHVWVEKYRNGRGNGR